MFLSRVPIIVKVDFSFVVAVRDGLLEQSLPPQVLGSFGIYGDGKRGFRLGE